MVEMHKGMPCIHPCVHRTTAGTPYLQQPGVVMLAKPEVCLEGMRPFLSGFAPELQFGGYIDDETDLPPAEQLCKAAGQICYASFGPGRTKNDQAQKYFDNIISSGHGSVLEHANFSFLFYGISRSVTHELVRHRAGCAFSQVSQRYVSGSVLRFVERPEYVNDPELHPRFEERIDHVAAEYAEVAEKLVARQAAGTGILSGERKTDLRKKVQQCARSVLPNETEAPIVMTANVRAWRHICNMRANQHAEIEIRELLFRALLCLKEATPILFGDFVPQELDDGTWGVSTPYPKV